MMYLSVIVFALSLFCLLLVFGYPLLLLFVPKRPVIVLDVATSDLPLISLLIVTHNGEALIRDKLENSISLTYPVDRYEIVVFSDGCTDGTERIVSEFASERIRFLSHSPQEGKNSALNKAVNQCRGEIVVLSDTDAILSEDSLLHMVSYFADPTVGGVTGRRIIQKDSNVLKDAQSLYIKFDSFLKSAAGDTTGNDGKIYAIRRSVFAPMPHSVADDLYVWLTVIRAGYRFLYTEKARAVIRVPARNTSHDIQRRRRIISTSLRGIYLMRTVLNPFKYGIFSITLFVNKILRRLLPVFLIVLLTSSILASAAYPPFKIISALQLAFYATAVLYPFLLRHVKILKINKVGSIIYYFCIGNYGMLLGTLDFLTGKEITSWTPKKV
ncbi:MAG: glycosyltransferase [Magnetococcales bacterium]|nr:glycosyltransferase [Nitrospirota bacterium]